MSHIRTLSTVTSLIALAACGASDSGAPLTEAEQLVAQASVYTPVFRDGTTTQADYLTDQGLSGVMAFEDGTVRAVRLRLSPGAGTAYLSVDGGPEREYPIALASISPTSGTWFTGTSRISASYPEGTFTGATFLQSFDADARGEGVGYVGARLPLDQLPNGPVTYFASLSPSNSSEPALSGTMNFTVDFGQGTSTGTLTGLLENAGPGTIPFGADLTGVVQQGIVAMTSEVDSNGVAGSVNFVGANYISADRLAGAYGATLNGETMGGYFNGTPPK